MRILFFILLLCLPAQAAYRVFQLKITYYDDKGKEKGHLFVYSTLDQTQYEHYNAGYRWMRVEYVDSWYCPGDTGKFRRYCEKPKTPERALASDGERVYLPIPRQPVIP